MKQPNNQVHSDRTKLDALLTEVLSDAEKTAFKHQVNDQDLDTLVADNAQPLQQYFTKVVASLQKLKTDYEMTKYRPISTKTKPIEEAFTTFAKQLFPQWDVLNAFQVGITIAMEATIPINHKLMTLVSEVKSQNNALAMVLEKAKIIVYPSIEKINGALKELEQFKSHALANEHEMKDKVNATCEEATKLKELKKEVLGKIENLNSIAKGVEDKLNEVKVLQDLEREKNNILAFMLKVADEAVKFIEKLILITILAIIALTIAAVWSCGLTTSLLSLLKTALDAFYSVFKVLKQVQQLLQAARNFSWGDLLKLAADQIGLTSNIEHLTDKLDVEGKIKDGISSTLENTKVKAAIEKVQILTRQALDKANLSNLVGNLNTTRAYNQSQ